LWEWDVYLVSDWAILNDTKSQQLQRILAEFHHLTESEIHLACILLESYHTVYRRDRLEQRRNQLKSGQTRIQERCLPPTPTQLDEITKRVNFKATLRLRTEEVLTHLQALAKRLRQYCIYVRASLRKPESLNGQKNRSNFARIQPPEFRNNWDNQDKSAELLVLHHAEMQCPECELTYTQKNGRRCGR
jgi:hypothetical protein